MFDESATFKVLKEKIPLIFSIPNFFNFNVTFQKCKTIDNNGQIVL